MGQSTGSGKSMLIADIEQWADGETPSKRRILINEIAAGDFAEDRVLRGMAAEVSQNMNFVMDMNVRDFLKLHACSRQMKQTEKLVEKVLDYANELSGEPIHNTDRLTELSGGQSRALMVADSNDRLGTMLGGILTISPYFVEIIVTINHYNIDRVQNKF